MRRVSWLNLHLFIPQRDVRKLIYRLLSKADRILVSIAHMSTIPFQHEARITKECAKYGYIDLLKWALNNGCIFGDWAMKKCIKYNQVAIVPLLRPSTQYCTLAALYGNLLILQTLRSTIDCP